jgi:hypothetical protein
MINNVKGGHKNKQSYSNKRTTGKEQYYTSSQAVEICLQEVQKHIDLTDKFILEPAGGTGEFIKGFQKIGIANDKIISYDIEPKHELVNKQDFLELNQFPSNKMVSITNPPFGRMSTLAIKFFNHSAPQCDYICYLIPRSWRKWTTMNRLDENFHLLADIDMPKDCFYLDGGESKKGVLNTVFQIWEKRDYKREKTKVKDNNLIKKINKNKDGMIVGANFSMVIFGHSCGRCEDVTEDVIPYKTTTMYMSVEREDVKQALRQIDFSCFYKNVAYVEALSIQEINYKLNEFFGLSEDSS